MPSAAQLQKTKQGSIYRSKVREEIYKSLTHEVPLTSHDPQQPPVVDAPAEENDRQECERLAALAPKSIILSPALCPADAVLTRRRLMAVAPRHIVAACAAAIENGLLLELGPHCLDALAYARDEQEMEEILKKGLVLPGGRKRAHKELEDAVWRATSEFPLKSRLSQSRLDGIALRAAHHVVPLTKPQEGEKPSFLDWHHYIVPRSPGPAGTKHWEERNAGGIRKQGVPADLPRQAHNLDKILENKLKRAENAGAHFWLVGDTARGYRERREERVDEQETVCAPVRSLSRTNMSLSFRDKRCEQCVQRAHEEWEDIQSEAAPNRFLVHPYLASFLRVIKCPPDSTQQSRVPIYIDVPTAAAQESQGKDNAQMPPAEDPSRGAARLGNRHEVLRCTKCGHTGQIAKMLPHVVVCHAVAKGRVPVSLTPQLCQQAGAKGEAAPGMRQRSGAGQAPARVTTEKWDLALLQLSIFGNPPPPDSSWSKDLPFSVLLLNLDGALLNRWPYLVAEINATSQLPLLVVLSEADVQDELWQKVQRLLEITLQHRYAIIRAARAVALVAHSLQLPAMRAPALIPGADDVMAIQIAHKDLSGEILAGYVSPNKNRASALRALTDYVAENADDLCLAAGDWNLAGGPVYEEQRRPGAVGRLWDELGKTKLTSVLPPDEPTFRGAETQPDILWIRKQPGQNALAMATVTEPSRLPVSIYSHRRIDWRGKAAPGPGSNGPIEVGGEPPPVPPGFSRRFKFEVQKATDESLEKAAEICRAALANGTFNPGTMEAALRKAGVPRSKSRRPPLPMPLIQDSGKLTSTSEEAANVFRARVMEGRPASLRRTPAEQKEHDAEVEKLIAEAPDDPFEATWDTAYRARKRLNKNAAPGSDGVSARFLFVCDTLLLVLVQCICAAYNALCDPPWTKTYLVNFLFKAKKRAASIFVARFYRPVTLINVIDKLSEAVVLEKLTGLLAVVKDNFAYHGGWSPAAGLLRSLLYTLSSSAPYIGVIVGDVQGGFENALLLHVLRVLAAKGAGRQVLKAIVNWFTGRAIIIMVDGLLSAATAISEGLGQGTLLSPALFRIVVEEGMTQVGFRTNQSFAEVVTGFSDDLGIFCIAWTERGNQLLDMPYPVDDFRIALLRCPEDLDATDRRKRALARRFQVRLKNGVLLTLPETWSQPEDDGFTVSAAAGDGSWHPEAHISILGVPLTANSAAWASWLEDQRRAVEAATTTIRSKLLDQDNKDVQSPLDLVDQYHQKIFSTLLYMGSVKAVLCPWVLPALDGLAEDALRKLLKVSVTAPFYTTFVSSGALVPSVAALAERKTNNTQILGLDSEEYRTTMRVGDVFDHGWFGWNRALISLSNEAGPALPDNVVLLTCADVCRRVGLSNKKENTPEIARRIKAEFEDLERSLGSALLWVATDSGNDPTDLDPSMRVGTIVMRYGHDRDADCAFALRLAHLFTTFIGEAGAVISALTILDDSADVPEAPLNSPQLRYVVFQIDAAGVIDDLKSNIREQLWVRARQILARLGKRYEGRIVFVLHWVPGHSGISPHQHADEIQKTPGPRVPMEAFVKPVVPLRQLRAFIRKELTKQVRKTVGIRGNRHDPYRHSGGLRGAFAANFGCLRPLLRGLSPVQQEIVFSVLSGDGRIAAREVGSTVGENFIVCGLCGQHVSAKTLSTQMSQFSQLADDVALPPASQPAAASPPEAASDADVADGVDAMSVDDGGAAAQAPADDAQVQEPEQESDGDQEADAEETKTSILWCHMARHFVEGDCTKIVEWYSGADEDPVSPRESMKKPERLLRALLALAGHPAPDEWPVKKTAAPKRDEDPLREVELKNVSDAADTAAQVIEGHWVFPPATLTGPSSTLNPDPQPQDRGLNLPRAVHRTIAPPLGATQMQANDPALANASRLFDVRRLPREIPHTGAYAPKAAAPGAADVAGDNAAGSGQQPPLHPPAAALDDMDLDPDMPLLPAVPQRPVPPPQIAAHNSQQHGLSPWRGRAGPSALGNSLLLPLRPAGGGPRRAERAFSPNDGRQGGLLDVAASPRLPAGDENWFNWDADAEMGVEAQWPSPPRGPRPGGRAQSLEGLWDSPSPLPRSRSRERQGVARNNRSRRSSPSEAQVVEDQEDDLLADTPPHLRREIDRAIRRARR